LYQNILCGIIKITNYFYLHVCIKKKISLRKNYRFTPMSNTGNTFPQKNNYTRETQNAVAFVLCGGYAKRLGSNNELPKVLRSVNAKPIIEHVLQPYVAAKVGKIVLLVAHKGDVIQEYFATERGKSLGGDATEIAFTDQETPGGVLPAVALGMIEHVNKTTSTTMVCDGDTILHGLDVVQAHDFHLRRGSNTTFVSTNMSSEEKYWGPAVIGDAQTGTMQRIDPEAPRGLVPDDVSFTGTMIMDPAAMDMLRKHDTAHNSWQDMVEILIAGGSVNQFYDETYKFLNLNTVDAIEQAEVYFQAIGR
jgi:NDP-sugar pyrophosphorylase family protein